MHSASSKVYVEKVGRSESSPLAAGTNLVHGTALSMFCFGFSSLENMPQRLGDFMLTNCSDSNCVLVFVLIQLSENKGFHKSSCFGIWLK